MKDNPYNSYKPDILIPFQESEVNHVLPAEKWENTAYAMIYVRPESNKVQYEGKILNGIKKYAKVVYMANLNGFIFLEHNILKSHYSSQFRFATAPREEMERYPEIIRKFEEYFGTSFETSKIMGSFGAVGELNMSETELFEYIVPKIDFVSLYGQTFKKIQDLFVVNYDLPAIIKKYIDTSNVFVVLVKCENANRSFFTDINQSIYNEIISCPDTPLIFGDKLGTLEWYEKIRRTYHISTNHVMAMFDMADFIYKNDHDRYNIPETPLGLTLIDQKAVPSARLKKIKAEHLCYSNNEGEKFLNYMPQSGIGKDIYQIINIFREISAE